MLISTEKVGRDYRSYLEENRAHCTVFLSYVDSRKPKCWFVFFFKTKAGLDRRLNAEENVHYQESRAGPG